MTDDGLDISRRQALAALGSIGVASAGAGLGTSAFFSDQESFANNRLTAGSLDLKVDWEEHYSDWSADEDDPELDVRMEEPDDVGAYQRYPPGVTDATEGTGSVWVANGDVAQFQDNTSIEALPDDNDDGIASYIDFVGGEERIDGFPGTEGDASPTVCDILADVGDDDGGLSSEARTRGTVRGQTTDPGDPLINLQDVKPGDFGEVTFSAHLCDNDGYLWLNAPGGLTAAENGITEPEAKDEDEDEDEPREADTDSPSDDVELPDVIRTAIWYDNNCNNVPDVVPEPVDLIVIADTSNSISDQPGNDQLGLLKDAADAFAEELPTGTVPSGPRAGEEIVRVGLLSFASGEAVPDPVRVEATVGPVEQFLDGNGNGIAGDFLPDETAGNTPMPGALDIARKILNDPTNEGVRGSDVEKKILLVTDGAPNYASFNGGVNYDVVYDGTPISSETFTQGDTVEDDDPGGGDDDPATGSPTDPFEGTDDFDDTARPDNVSSDQERYETWQLAKEGADFGFTPIDGDTTNDDDGMEILVAGIANETVGLGDALDSYLEMFVASEPDLFYDTNFGSDLQATARQIARDVAMNGEGEEYIVRGETLRDTIDLLTSNGGRGIPLDGDRSTGFNELDDPADDPDRECFDASATHCFGFSWWVPLNHGNEIQSDSAEFDIGFYTEQCRHNDGAGMGNVPDA